MIQSCLAHQEVIFLIALLGTHSINHIHILCRYNLIQKLETSECSHLLSTILATSSPIPPFILRPSFVFAPVQEISAFCNRCRNKFDKKANPPYDICVQHGEWWSYTSPTTNLPNSRFGNAYHANPACIMSKWPSFHPQSLLISNEEKNQLQAQITFIFAFWYLSLNLFVTKCVVFLLSKTTT